MLSREDLQCDPVAMRERAIKERSQRALQALESTLSICTCSRILKPKRHVDLDNDHCRYLQHQSPLTSAPESTKRVDGHPSPLQANRKLTLRLKACVCKIGCFWLRLSHFQLGFLLIHVLAPRTDSLQKICMRNTHLKILLLLLLPFCASTHCDFIWQAGQLLKNRKKNENQDLLGGGGNHVLRCRGRIS